jgi:hypothetical protein
MDYQICLEEIRKLDAISKYSVEDSGVEKLAKLAYRYPVLPLDFITGVIEIMADSKTLGGLDLQHYWVGESFIDKIRPWVEDVRQELFNSRTAPFSTRELASMWIDKSIEEAQEIDPEFEKRKEVFFDKYPFLKDYPFLASKYEEYPKWEPTIGVLFEKAGEIAKATGFNFPSVAFYILANIKPILPKYELEVQKKVTKLSSGEDLVNKFVTVTIRGYLDFDMLRSLYINIRKELGIKRTKALTAKHVEFFRIVEEVGVPPNGKGTIAFWEKVKDKCNEKHSGGKRYSDWRGAKQLYDRIVKRCGLFD